MLPGPVDVVIIPSLLASTQFSAFAAILVTPPGSRLDTATLPSRLTDVRDGLPPTTR